MKTNEVELIKEIYLKKSNYLKEMINTLIPICFYLCPFGLLNYKAEKEKEKILLLKQKNIFKQKINLIFQETKDSDVKKILGIFLTSL